MIDRVDNYKQLKYLENIMKILEVLGEWDRMKPTETTKQLVKAATQIGFYVNNLELDLLAHRTFESEYRQHKVRAIERARKAEERVAELEKQIENRNQLRL